MTFVLFLACSIVVYWVTYKIFDSIMQETQDVLLSEKDYLKASEERAIQFENFSAWTECPRCLHLDLHPIKDTLTHSCRRECTNCKKVWRQV